MDLHGYLRVLRKNWWLIVLVAVIGAGGGYVVSARSAPLYASSVTFYVSTPTEAAGGNAFQANQYAQSRIESYTRLMTSERLAKMIIAKAGLKMSPSAVASRISASSDLNTVLLTARVTDGSAARSLAICTAIASEFGKLVDDLDNRAGVQDSTVVLNVTSGPTLNPYPVSPRKKLSVLVGFGAGLVLGVVLSLLRELLDTSVRSADGLRALTGIPVIGSIRQDRVARKTPVLSGERTRSIRAEAYRQLRTNLQFVDAESPVGVLVVTSSIAGEGKSSTATNLAIVSAETGRRVLLIEADLRRPKISTYLGLEGASGLTNVLVGETSLDDVLQTWGENDLRVLPSGTIPPNPSELLGGRLMADLMARVREEFDVVVIDTPPVLPVTDASVVAAFADGAIVVVRYGKTARHQVVSAVEALQAVDARLVGTVLNQIPGRRFGRGDSKYGYYNDDGKRGSRRASWASEEPDESVDGDVTDAPKAGAMGTAGPAESPAELGKHGFARSDVVAARLRGRTDPH